MKVIKPQKLSLVSRCFEQERRYFMSVGVLTLHELSGALIPEMEMWQFLPKVLGADAIPDVGMVKSRGEVLVTGSAYTPGGVPAASAEVSLRCGSVDKRLVVTGDRVWKRENEAGDPVPFVSLPLDWAHAFGGPDLVTNPLGKGFAPVMEGEDEVHLLPNVELKGAPIKSRKEKSSPVSLGPIDFLWPQRQSKVGTYDQAWLEDLFPGHALDMDWSIFNLAPEDQQLEGPFNGDETFALSGMHPHQEVFEGSLPQFTPRVFINRSPGDEPELEEVALALTTLWLFPESERYLLVHHGAHQVQEDDAWDVLHVILAAEDQGKPRDLAHYEEVLRVRLDPEKGAIHALNDKPLLPEDPELNSAPNKAMDEGMALLETEGLQQKHQRAKAERDIAEAREKLVALGLDPDLHGPRPLPPEEPPKSILETYEELEEQKKKSAQDMEEKKAWREEKDADIRARIEAEGLDADAIMAEPDTKKVGPPTYSAEGETQKIAAMAAAYRAEGTPIEELEYYATDPGRRKMLDDAEAAQRESYRMLAHHQDPPPRLEGELAAAGRAAAQATLQSHGHLRRQNLTGFDLSGLDLSGVDLQGAWMENANLAGTDFSGANLAEAVLTRADLSGATLDGASLVKANLGLATLHATRGRKADFTEAILAKAKLREASLEDACFLKADFSEIEALESDLSGADLSELPFLKTDLSGLQLTGSTLLKAIFLECDLSGVDFQDAHLASASFVDCKGAGAQFDRANLSGAVFVQDCSFEGAVFREATLEMTNLRGTGLADSDFSGAQLQTADLSECDLSRAKFVKTRAIESLFIRSNFQDADLVSADFMGSILQKADLRGADLRDSNLYATDLSLVRKGPMTLLDGSNQTKARLVPEFRPPEGPLDKLPWNSR